MCAYEAQPVFSLGEVMCGAKRVLLNVNVDVILQSFVAILLEEQRLLLFDVVARKFTL